MRTSTERIASNHREGNEINTLTATCSSRCDMVTRVANPPLAIRRTTTPTRTPRSESAALQMTDVMNWNPPPTTLNGRKHHTVEISPNTSAMFKGNREIQSAQPSTATRQHTHTATKIPKSLETMNFG